MRKLKFVGLAAVCATILFTGTAGADEYNKQTFLTFSGPVSLPGITLPAGTYTFQIANPDSGSRVIRVSDKDNKRTVRGLFFAIPSQLADPPKDPVVKFAERAEGSPEAIKAWYYPGERTGYEFVYPRSQAVRIAKANHEKVLSFPDPVTQPSADAEPTEVFKNARVERVDENSQLSEVPRSPVVTNEAPRQAQSNVGSTSAEARLPQTASPLALLQLLSVLSIAGGLGVRSMRASR